MSRIVRVLTFVGLLVVAVPILFAGWIWLTVVTFDTETLPPRYGQTDAVLFSRPGGPRPLIVGLGGAEGGNAWASDRWADQRQRFLDQGYAFLAIGYFGLDNTPEQLDRIALEGVHAAMAAALRDPSVQSDCAIVIGGSKGAELALALGANYPDIDAVIAISPADVAFPGHTEAFTTSSWARDGEQLPFVPMPWSTTWDLLNGRIGAVMRRMLEDEEAVKAATFPTERIGGPLLLISARQDELWPATQMAERIMTRLDTSGFPFVHEHIAVDGSHADSARHFDQIEAFLARAVATRPGCQPAQMAL